MSTPTPANHLKDGLKSVRCGRQNVQAVESLDDVTCRRCIELHEADERERAARKIAAEATSATPRMNREQKRARARQLRANGIDPSLMFVRYDIDGPGMEKLTADTNTWADVVAYHIEQALTTLEEEGGDVHGTTVITVGAHPVVGPGGTRIEIKTTEKKVGTK